MGMLDGKVAVVTGCGAGLGRAYALAMGAAGAAVVCGDIDEAAAQRVAADIVAAGGRARGMAADVSRWATGEELVGAAVDAFGKLDVLVNNAGIVRDRMMWNLTEDDVDAVYRVHLKGTFACGIAAARHMRDRGEGGVILNVTSTAHHGHRGQSNYSGMKGGIASVTYTWALELARFGIRVNAISPIAWTAMTQTMAKTEEEARALQQRMGEPEMVAPVAVYLASDEAAWVTGQVVAAGGERVSLGLHPRDAYHAFRSGGWTAEELARRFRATAGARLEPCGSDPAYPWYDGVRPAPAPAASQA